MQKTFPCNIQIIIKISFPAENNLYLLLNFAQNIDCGYTLKPPRQGGSQLTSTHQLCFGSKLRTIDIALYTPGLLYKGWGIRG